MFFRVCVGATLSTIDAVTDIYVIATYYESDELKTQATALVTMITLNLIIQVLMCLGQFRKKHWTVKMKELLITLMFLRPAADAYRVSTNQHDDALLLEPLAEMIFNKGIELATESIPGCVLQVK